MEIRIAVREDLPRIMELGGEFGHLMGYQKDPVLMEKYLDRILVAEETYKDDQIQHDYYVSKEEGVRVVGYYHYIVLGDLGFEDMLRCYRQFPESIIDEASMDSPGELCVIMQGACHREVARLFYGRLMDLYPEIWVYCSAKSRKPETYKELGFTFDPREQFSFFNVSKGDYSTYRLGRWTCLEEGGR